jgi:hypothetical protein
MRRSPSGRTDSDVGEPIHGTDVVDRLRNFVTKKMVQQPDAFVSAEIRTYVVL